MRRQFMLILVLLTLLLVAAGVVLLIQQRVQPPVGTTVPPDELAGVPRVTAQELRGQLATSNPPLVWDFRSATSFAEGHIPGSRPLTFDELPDAAAGLDKRLPIVTLCA